MQYLLDTGILLRLVNRDDPLHDLVLRSVVRIKSRGDVTVTTHQNLAEFWNVSTRPLEARGGLGLTLDEAARRLRVIERVTTRLPDSEGLYSRWKDLVLTHGVRGVQVHDAKLVALMMLAGVTHILTLNPRDFARFSGISAVTPQDLIASPVGTIAPAPDPSAASALILRPTPPQSSQAPPPPPPPPKSPPPAPAHPAD